MFSRETGLGRLVGESVLYYGTASYKFVNAPLLACAPRLLAAFNVFSCCAKYPPFSIQVLFVLV